MRNTRLRMESYLEVRKPRVDVGCGIIRWAFVFALYFALKTTVLRTTNRACVRHSNFGFTGVLPFPRILSV